MALVQAVGSGKLMDEDWLRDGQVDHLVDGLHLLAWLLSAIAASLHGIAVLQRGGLPLARSMASLQVRSADRPGQWVDQTEKVHIPPVGGDVCLICSS